MIKIEIGDYILNPKNNEIHIVNDCEVVSDVELIYTEDRKCFPTNEVVRISGNNAVDIFTKMILGEQLTEVDDRCLTMFFMKHPNMFLKDPENFEETL